MICTPRTIQFYEFTLGKISEWFEGNGIYEPNQTTSRIVRALLGELVDKGYSNYYTLIHARVIRTFTKFLLNEKYISQIIRDCTINNILIKIQIILTQHNNWLRKI